jgi:hypothetical protein
MPRLGRPRRSFDLVALKFDWHDDPRQARGFDIPQLNWRPPSKVVAAELRHSVGLARHPTISFRRGEALDGRYRAKLTIINDDWRASG